MLKISLDLNRDAGHKGGGFSKTLLEKSLRFVPSRGDSTVIFNLGLLLLPADVDLIPKEQGFKEDKLGTCDIGHIKMVLAMLIEVITLYMGAIIV